MLGHLPMKNRCSVPLSVRPCTAGGGFGEQRCCRWALLDEDL